MTWRIIHSQQESFRSLLSKILALAELSHIHARHTHTRIHVCMYVNMCVCMHACVASQPANKLCRIHCELIINQDAIKLCM